MFTRTLRKLATVATAMALFTSGVHAADVIKIGAIAPKTGGLAGGAVVTQWPNVELWVKQVNARGGLDVGGKMM